MTAGKHSLTVNIDKSLLNLELKLNGKSHRFNFTVGFYKTYNSGGDKSLTSQFDQIMTLHQSGHYSFSTIQKDPLANGVFDNMTHLKGEVLD